MSPFAQVTEVDHEGAVANELTEDQIGSPERLKDRQHPSERGRWHTLPDRRDIPSPCHGRLAYSRSEETIASCYNQSLLGAQHHCWGCA